MEELRKAVYERCKELVCRKCKSVWCGLVKNKAGYMANVHPALTVFRSFCESMGDEGCVPQQDDAVSIDNKEECGDAWVRSLFVFHELTFDELFTTLPQYVTILSQNLEAFEFYVHTFQWRPTMQPSIEAHIATFANLIISTPNVNPKNYPAIYDCVAMKHSATLGMATEQAFIKSVIYRHSVWDSWYMDTHKYTKYIEWLPSEMIEDAISLL